MNQFIIESISKKPKKIYGLLSYEGQITIGGELKETFVMPLTNLSLRAYQQQWKEGLARIKDHNFSCLVTTVQNLDANALVELWSLYKEGKTVFIRNQLLNRTIAAELHLPLKLMEFNLQNCYKFINYPRRVASNDAEKCMEWSVELDDISKAYENLLNKELKE